MVSSEIMRNSDVSMKISHIPIIRLMKKLEKQVIDLIVTTVYRASDSTFLQRISKMKILMLYSADVQYY